VSVALARIGVPPEFTGLARQLRDAIGTEVEPSADVMTELALRITDRIRRGSPIPRADVLAGTAHDWRHRLPERGRLVLEIHLDRRKKSLRIREMRAGPSIYQPQSWDVAEHGVLINGYMLEAWAHHFDFKILTLVHVGLHGFAWASAGGSNAGSTPARLR